MKGKFLYFESHKLIQTIHTGKARLSLSTFLATYMIEHRMFYATLSHSHLHCRHFLIYHFQILLHQLL